ncbi:hypothetical protein ElyMa_002298900 [Elysia marginata]|uniref:Uncharacterized protein n=1 Tax=Elysia marginata TaxID=1093978 RepID=A0AAV4G3T9_9GAST|nr:hypothetical protein ElyMa_002298900 [Elysia marginata]
MSQPVFVLTRNLPDGDAITNYDICVAASKSVRRNGISVAQKIGYRAADCSDKKKGGQDEPRNISRPEQEDENGMQEGRKETDNLSPTTDCGLDLKNIHEHAQQRNI